MMLQSMGEVLSAAAAAAVLYVYDHHASLEADLFCAAGGLLCSH
jgi:hypothetical protein